MVRWRQETEAEVIKRIGDNKGVIYPFNKKGKQTIAQQKKIELKGE